MALTDEKEAQKLIQQQKIVGFIEIPVNFQKKLYQTDQQTIICYTNNQFMLFCRAYTKGFSDNNRYVFCRFGNEKETTKRITNRKS